MPTYRVRVPGCSPIGEKNVKQLVEILLRLGIVPMKTKETLFSEITSQKGEEGAKREVLVKEKGKRKFDRSNRWRALSLHFFFFVYNDS